MKLTSGFEYFDFGGTREECIEKAMTSTAYAYTWNGPSSETLTTKRGGARPGAGQPRKPAENSVSVRFSLALTPAEADEYRRRGATTWVRRMLQQQNKGG